MLPRKSFVPKIDFGTLAKKYRLGATDNKDEEIINSGI